MFNSTTSVEQGINGLAKAISYFVSKNYIISLPLVDNQAYDLIFDDGIKLNKVDVKTSQYKKNGSFLVQLKSVRTNKHENKIYRFDGTKVDFVFILTGDKDLYLIPAMDVHDTNQITLSSKCDKYRILES
jgi:hypothetical protein